MEPKKWQSNRRIENKTTSNNIELYWENLEAKWMKRKKEKV